MAQLTSPRLGAALAAALLPLPLLIASMAARADDAALRQLVEQGRFWEQRDQPERTRAAWQRVLSVDPNNAEALSHLAILSARTGDRSKAQEYLDHLSSTSPNSPFLAQARSAVSAGPVKSGGDTLARARSLAAAKDYNGAIAAYRESFGGGTPPPAVAMEYYQTLGATSGGWAEARDGLATLAKQNPGDARYELAYAQHLTYREEARRDGIDRLADLAQAQGGNAAARNAWRQALIWLQPRPDDTARYTRYLNAEGGDAEVKKRLDSLRSEADSRRAAAQGTALKGVYEDINHNDLDTAEQKINGMLRQQPDNADALGALGVLRLRQGRYTDAQTSLQRAQSLQPSQAGRYRDALRSATFWRHIQSAQLARDNGNAAAAESEYSAAFAQPPSSGAPDALRVAYADVLIERQRDGVAEPMLRDVLKRNPDNPDAMRGLLTILSRSGRGEEALKLADRAPPQMQTQLNGLRADQLRARAGTESTRGDLAAAQSDLEQAMVLAPTSPWVRLDLAKIYRARGRDDQAQSLLDGLAQTDGNLPEVRMAQAYAYGESNDWWNVLQSLEQMPPAQRSADAARLQRRAWINYQLQRARTLVAAHRPAEAYDLVEQASDAAGNDPEFMSAAAGGWAALGDPARAVGSMHRVLARTPKPDPALRIQYASLLLEAGQDGEFEVVSDDLATRAVLTSAQQAQLDSLIVGYRVKLADRARTQNKPGEAYVQLRDVIARYPDDPRVQMALARLLTASGDTAQAESIYGALLKREPVDESARLGLIDTRLAAGDAGGADTLITAGMRANPDDARYWKAAGRLAESQGRRGAALNAYERAARLEGKAAPQATDAAPQLAWIDPDKQQQILSAPLVEALSSVAPSTGPLRPRAASVALPPDANAFAPSDGVTSNGIAGLSPNLGTSERSLWLNPPGRPGVRLKAAQQIGPGGSGMPRHPEGEAAAAPEADSISRLEAATSGWVDGGFATRSRTGQAGLSQLSDLEMPLQWRSRETSAGRLGVDVTPVYLDAGVPSGTDKLGYGTLAIANGVGATTSSASGAALGLNYNYGFFTADIGTSPLGFLEERLLGGIKLSAAPGDWRLGLDLSRRAVTDSLLSYAGMKDALTGKTWGGVSRTGGRGDLGYDAGDFGIYGNLGFYTLDGHNVDSNTEFTLGAGLYARGWSSGTQVFTYGLNFTGFSYDKNLRYFSFGQGGYFSPKIFMAITVPVEWTGTSGRLSYRFNGALGLQSFREDGNALYPGFAGLQAQLEAAAAAQPSLNLPLGYSSVRNSGLGYALGGNLEYRMFPKLSIGGHASVDNSKDYREFQLTGYLRYYFSEQPLPPSLPTPVVPHYAQ